MGRKQLHVIKLKCCDLIGFQNLGTLETLDSSELFGNEERHSVPTDYWVETTRERVGLAHHHLVR